MMTGCVLFSYGQHVIIVNHSSSVGRIQRTFSSRTVSDLNRSGQIKLYQDSFTSGRNFGLFVSSNQVKKHACAGDDEQRSTDAAG